MTAPQNALLFNAALEGFLAGTCKDRPLTAVNSGTPPAIGTGDLSYEALVAQASNFAVEADSMIATDDTAAPQPAGTEAISVITTGVAIAPSTGAIQMGQIAKSRLLAACALSVYEGRYFGQPDLLTPTELSDLSSKVTSTYLKLAAPIVQPFTAATIHNQVLFFGAYAGLAAGVGAGTYGQMATDQAAVLSAALEGFALAVDALIAFDSTITAASANGAALAPSTGSITQLQLGKFRLMESICLAVSERRSPVSLLSNSAELTAWITAQSAAVAALYNATAGGILPGANAALNPALYNEAYCGFVAGNIAGRPITSTNNSDPNYVAVGVAATAFATEVDATVGAVDVVGTAVPTGTQAISVAGEGTNTTLTPSTGAIQEGELGKTGLLWAICRGVQHGRPLLNNALDTTPSTYANIAKSIVSLYLLSATALATPA